MDNFMYLDSINSPEDIKKLNITELSTLCQEIRTFLVDSVSKTGGHLASNIGAVELSVALHYVFDSPVDHLMFDVGHQSYVHKILTGRKDKFDTLRKLDGISGFLKPEESEHDCFISGHSSNSISAMLGMARADKLNNINSYSVALIGDGALTGGMAYEALNDAGCSELPLIIVLNDNDMSISKSVGGLATWLSNMRLSPKYFTFKNRTLSFLKKFGKTGDKLVSILSSLKGNIRKNVLPENIFSSLGFKYLGPADGNNIETVIALLTQAKKLNRPVVVHFKTIKGKGYSYSEDAPDEYHSVSSFDTKEGKSISSSESFSSVFGNTLTNISSKDSRVCAITAAMDMGTGLTIFKETFPDRFFDVGIAEQHAVTMSAGIAKRGLLPVCAIYSTFMQRAYDQLLHDVSLNNAHVVFGIDRSGPVGSDGPTHHGLFDTSYLRSIPNMVIYAPSSYAELSSFINKALYEHQGPVSIKYSRNKEGIYSDDSSYEDAKIIEEGSDITIITYGILINEALDAAKLLKEKGINVELIKLNRLDKLDSSKIINSVSKTNRLIVCEDSIESGSIGESVLSLLMQSNVSVDSLLINFKNSFGEIGTVKDIYKKHGLDAKSIVSSIIDIINR